MKQGTEKNELAERNFELKKKIIIEKKSMLSMYQRDEFNYNNNNNKILTQKH